MELAVIIAISVPLIGVPAFLLAARAERHGHEVVAARTGLRLTPANLPLLMRYARLTNRWRTIGLVTALCVIVIFLPHSRDQPVPAPLFIGWFLGAVLAEFHLLLRPCTSTQAAPPDQPTATPRTTASPAKRQAPPLLSRPALVFLWLGPVFSVLAAGAAITLQPTTATWEALVAARIAVVLGVLTSVAVLALVRVLQRRPLTGTPDLAAAGVAMRTRSARTLATGGAVFGLLILTSTDTLGLLLPESASLLFLFALYALPVAALVVGLQGSMAAKAIQGEQEAASIA